MKKLGFLVSLGLVIVMLEGCNPCQRLALKCPSHDSTTIVIETVHDTVWVKAPIRWMDLITPIRTLEDLGDIGLAVENEAQKVTVKILHDTLFIKSTCKEDSLMAIIEHLNTTINNTHTIYQEVEVEKEVIRNGKFARFTMIAFFCCVILLVGYLYLKVRAGAFKTALSQVTNLFGKG